MQANDSYPLAASTLVKNGGIMNATSIVGKQGPDYPASRLGCAVEHECAQRGK